MKTTLELPDPIFRRAKAKAAEQKIPLRQFVSDAVAEKLETKSPARAKERATLAGGLAPRFLRMMHGSQHCAINILFPY